MPSGPTGLLCKDYKAQGRAAAVGVVAQHHLLGIFPLIVLDQQTGRGARVTLHLGRPRGDKHVEQLELMLQLHNSAASFLYFQRDDTLDLGVLQFLNARGNFSIFKQTGGAFELEPATGELRKSGARLKLQSQHFALLTLLASRPGQIVTREEIRSALWDDQTFVDFDRSINFCVNQIRHALDDDPQKPRYT